MFANKKVQNTTFEGIFVTSIVELKPSGPHRGPFYKLGLLCLPMFAEAGLGMVARRQCPLEWLPDVRKLHVNTCSTIYHIRLNENVLLRRIPLKNVMTSIILFNSG